MFRIGEFSKIAQVPASLLRYYNDIGLFMPIESDRDTGYRYYSAQQLTQLNRILALKDLGLSLDQVKRLVAEEVSAEEIRGMLALKKAQIEQTLEAEALRLRAVESRLIQLDRQGQLKDDEVVLKSIPEQSFLSMRQTFADIPTIFAVLGDMQQVISMAVPAKSLGRFMVVICDDAYEMQDMDLEMGFLLNHDLDIKVSLARGAALTVRELPAIAMAATTMRYGIPEHGHLAYGAIGTWAETNQYQLINPGREVFIVPPKPGCEQDLVVEIQFPVQPIAA